MEVNMIGTLMLVFIMSVAGESVTLAVSFDSMQACESARATVIKEAKEAPTPSGAPILLVAAVCTTPVQVQVL